MFKDRMMYSLEDSFDKIIAADDFVYGKYVVTLKEVMNSCDTAMVLRISQKVFQELEVLSKDPQNCKVTQYLDRDAFDLAKAKDDMDKSVSFLLMRRTSILNKLR